MNDRLFRSLAPFATAFTIFAIASGSSSVRWIIEHTRGGIRWAALVGLCVFALAWAAVRRFENPLASPALAGAWFAGLAVTSMLWSASARLTFERSGSLVVLFLAGWGFACAARGRRDVVGALLDGVLLGGGAVAAAGLMTLAFTHGNAVQPATVAYGARFQGYSQNPNTLGILLGVVLPVAVWRSVRSTGWKRYAAVVATLLLFGELVATGSRGSLAAALVGVVVLLAFVPRPLAVRTGAAVALTAIFAAGAAASHLAKPTTTVTPQPQSPPGRLTKDAERVLPLENEIGLPAPGAVVQRRRLLSSSGRFRAWRGAIRQGNDRPLAGYGLGTEDRVFVDRYYGFDSDLVENSYIGLYLQLGLAGVVSLLALLGTAVVPAARIARSEPTAVACLAVVAAGVVLAGSQSFLYSVGATATLPFWVCAFLASAVAPRRT